jgi:glycosyltransferase involved in cell wall biosynthesis
VVKLSVITPVLNGNPYIEKCLESVIQQNCSDIEHVIIDGGSVDNTLEVVQYYSSKYSHIRFISEKDRGQSDAMNKGISLAQGRILGVLNVDDTYEPGVFDRVLGLFDGLPEPALLVGNCNIWDEQGNLFAVNRPDKLRLRDLLLGPHVNPLPFNPSAYFYHASIHEWIGNYDVNEQYVLDWDFLLRAVQVATVHYVNETWGNFHMIEGSKTVEDLKSGESFIRQERILRHYRKDLSRMDALGVTIKYWYYNRLLSTVHYFQEKPEELPWRLRNRLLQLLHLPA